MLSKLFFERYSLFQKYADRNIKPPEVTVHEIIPECIVISKLNSTYLDFTPKINEIIVDSFCGAAVLRGSHVFAPGVMGVLPSNKIICICNFNKIIYNDIPFYFIIRNKRWF